MIGGDKDKMNGLNDKEKKNASVWLNKPISYNLVKKLQNSFFPNLVNSNSQSRNGFDFQTLFGKEDGKIFSSQTLFGKDNRNDFLSSSTSQNIYDPVATRAHNKKVDMFSSQSYICNTKFQVFRSPGSVLTRPPQISILNSVAAETGICYFFQISADTDSWYTVHLFEGTGGWKSIEDLGPELLLIEKDYSALSLFITTNITEVVYRRSNFLKHQNVLRRALIINNHLIIYSLDNYTVCCFCLKNLVVRALGDTQFVIQNDIFQVTCIIERDEWIKVLRNEN